MLGEFFNAERQKIRDAIVIAENITTREPRRSLSKGLREEGNGRFKFHLAREPTLIASGRLNFPFGLFLRERFHRSRNDNVLPHPYPPMKSKLYRERNAPSPVIVTWPSIFFAFYPRE